LRIAVREFADILKGCICLVNIRRPIAFGAGENKGAAVLREPEVGIKPPVLAQVFELLGAQVIAGEPALPFCARCKGKIQVSARRILIKSVTGYYFTNFNSAIAEYAP
jgi:hypothetical protein